MRRCLSVISLVVAVGSCGGGKKAGRPFHALPPLGARLLVLAPHPDDELLGAAGMIDVTVTTGTRSVCLALDAFRDIPGAVLEVLPQSPESVGPAWLLLWRGAPPRQTRRLLPSEADASYIPSLRRTGGL